MPRTIAVAEWRDGMRSTERSHEGQEAHVRAPHFGGRLPEEQEQIYMQLLTSKRLEVADSMRELILEEWPELAHCAEDAAGVMLRESGPREISSGQRAS
jgi:hypothetical protein